MEFQNIINLVSNATNQILSKLRRKNWVDKNDDSRGPYNENSQIRFKISILRTSLLDYSGRYILVKRPITITGRGTDAAARKGDERDKVAIFKSCRPFIKCIKEMKSTQVDDAHEIDIVMPMYNLNQI